MLLKLCNDSYYSKYSVTLNTLILKTNTIIIISIYKTTGDNDIIKYNVHKCVKSHILQSSLLCTFLFFKIILILEY